MKGALLQTLLLLIPMLGLGVVLIVLSGVMREGVPTPLFMAAGIGVMAFQIPALVSGVTHPGTRGGLLDLLSGCAGLAFGLWMLFQGSLAVGFAAAFYLLALPLGRVLLSANHRRAVRQEWGRMALGLLLSLLLAFSGVTGVLRVLLLVTGILVCALVTALLLLTVNALWRLKRLRRRQEADGTDTTQQKGASHEEA